MPGAAGTAGARLLLPCAGRLHPAHDRGRRTWLGHVWEHVALELQGIAGHDVTFGKTRSTGTPGEYDMVYQYRQQDVGLEAGELARRLILRLLPDDVQALLDEEKEPDYDWDAERDAFIRRAQRLAFGPSTQSLVDAAEARGIPWIRLNRFSLVQLGHGRHQQRIQATVTGQTQHIAVEIASDKEDTRGLLESLGLPVPRQALVYGPQDAVEAAHQIGFPVVVKPLNANHGRGVSIRLVDDAQVERGFEHASQHGSSQGVLVESFVSGFDHRMLVVNGHLVAVAKRVPGHVVGDGRHTIEELVEIVNRDPQRGVGHEKVLTQLAFDAQAERLLAKAGHTAATVLPDGEVFYLRSTANLSTGGTAIDLTDLVHPDNRDMAVPRRPRRRAGRGRRRLPLGRRHAVLARGRRRHRRGQRRAGLPDARGADRGDAARRGRAGHGHAVPAGRPSAHPGRRGHGHEREDDDHADGLDHPADGRPGAGHDLDRRRVHRRPADGQGRHDRAGGRDDGPARPRPSRRRSWR